MVGLRTSAPETSQVRMLSVCPIISGVLRLAVTTTEMGGAGGEMTIKVKNKSMMIN